MTFGRSPPARAGKIDNPGPEVGSARGWRVCARRV
jgi:hypothetical protein